MRRLGAGVVLSALYSDSIAAVGAGTSHDNPTKKSTIGIIGAENSHTIGFGRLFNIEKKFPGLEVKYVWGETEAFARNAMEKGQIPEMVSQPEEMLGKIDALIVDHRHGKYHLDAARPFVEAGIPSFIDKPFCYRADKGRRFLEFARKQGTPITSYSSIAHSYETFDIMEKVKQIGDIRQVIRYGRANIDSPYGGLFFYGPHSIEPLIYIFGEDIEKVRISRSDQRVTASLVYQNGLLATVIFTTENHGWSTWVETEDGLIELKSDLGPREINKADMDMVTMFKTGKEPRTHQSILKGVAVLEALERSVESQKWEQVDT